MAQDNEKDRDLGSDRPGRAHQSNGAARSAMEETDWHEEAEAGFLKDLVGKLSAMAFSREIEDIVVVAPPRALGLMRPYYSGSLKGAISAELAKDLVKHPVADIERLLAA
ncbi:Protein required for attachment to host cell [compost metagenome]